MYTSHFGFTEKPFKLKSAARYFYDTPAAQSARQTLTTAITDRQPLVLLTGPAGSGKTTLLQRSLDELSQNVQLLRLGNTSLSLGELIDQLCEQLALDCADQPLAERIRQLHGALRQAGSGAKTVVVVVDDAHAMSSTVLQDLVGLSRAGSSGDSSALFVLLAAGLPELQSKLDSGPNVVSATLDPLSEDETGAYINHQLSTAGYSRQDLFTPNSLELIGEFTAGNPRTINSLCDAALFIAAMEGQTLITPEIIDRAAQQCFLKDPERVSYDGEPKPAAAPEPLQPTALTGLTDADARKALGLRFGDVSEELAATVPAEELPNPFAEPEPQLDQGRAADPSPVQPEPVGYDAEQTAVRPTARRAAPPPVEPEWRQPEELALPGEGPPYDGIDRDAVGHDTVDLSEEFSDPPRPLRRKQSRGWLGLLVKLLLVGIVLAVGAVWLQPQWFGLNQNQLHGYLERLRGASELQNDAAVPISTTPAPTTPAPTTPAPTIPAPTIPAPTIPAPVASAPAASVPAASVPAASIPAAPAPVTPSRPLNAAMDDAVPVSETLNTSAADTPPANGSTPSSDSVALAPPTAPEPLPVKPEPAATPVVTDSAAATDSVAAGDTAPVATANVTAAAPESQPAADAAEPETTPPPATAAAEPSTPAYIDSLLDEAPPATTTEQAAAAVDGAAPAADPALAARIDQLLATAEEQTAADLLTTPADNNAYDTYQQVLTLQPDNPDARAGLTKIKQTYQIWARAALAKGAVNRARSYYQKALKVDPQDETLRTALEQLQQ